MNSTCLICLETLPADTAGDYHKKCLRRLFGTSKLPAFDLDPARMHELGGKMAGRVSISGVQKKISLEWSAGKNKSLRITAIAATYILKPATDQLPHLPENEHLCLCMARALGIPVPEAGLVRLSDDSLALVIRRFDRTDDNERLPMEDFCQLAQKVPGDKYRGSAELAAKLTQKYSDSPILDLRALFLQMLFSWWIGNGDLHLKNLSLLSKQFDTPRLSPAYDLVNTELYMPFEFALPLGGKQLKLRSGDWLRFAKRLDLPLRAIARDLDRFAAGFPKLLLLAEASRLPRRYKTDFIRRIASEYEHLSVLQARVRAAGKTSKPEVSDLAPRAVHETVLAILDELKATNLELGDSPLLSDLQSLDKRLVAQLSGTTSQDEILVENDLRQFFQAAKLLESLHARASCKGSGRATRHLKNLRFGGDDKRSDQAWDFVFELQVAARLASKHWSVSFQEPDLRITDAHGNMLSLACKRPRSLRSRRRNIRDAVQQCRKSKTQGVVAIDVEHLLPHIYMLCEDRDSIQERGREELKSLVEMWHKGDHALNLADFKSEPDADRLIDGPPALGILFCATRLALVQTTGKRVWMGRHFSTFSVMAPGQEGLADFLRFLENCLATAPVK